MGVPAVNYSTAAHHKPRFFGGIVFLSICSVCAWAAHSEWRNQPLVLFFGTIVGIIFLCLILTMCGAALSKFTSSKNRVVKIHGQCGETTILRVLAKPIARICSVSSFWEVNQGLQPLTGPEVFFRSDGKEEIVFNRRCRIHSDESLDIQVKRILVLGDPLGLFAFKIRTDLDVDILIEPSPFEAHSPSCIKSIADAANAKASPSGSPQGDLSEMREYREGDSARLIIWKVLAKTGGQRRMVRVEERVEAQRCALYLFATGPGDDRAASFVKHFLAQKSVAGDWVFGVSGSPDVFCRGKGGDIFKKVVNQLSKSGLLARKNDLITDFKDFVDKSKRLRIENPVAVVGVDSEDPLIWEIKSQSQRCGILIVRATGNPEFLK
jgi:hypothetical protein